jgi:Holliday junction DNA helicase RuvA
MIGYLNGTIELLDQPYLIIDVNGVGYRVLVSESTFLNLEKGQKLKIYTYTHVREDALELFGFLESLDLKLFENLLTVSGVGPKTALNIFSFGKRDDIIGAIISGDVSFFTSVPRLGTKNAQKIIIELKNKMGSNVEIDLSGKEINENKEVIAALKTFGFSTSESQDALKTINKQNLTTEEKIRLALKALGK